MCIPYLNMLYGVVVYAIVKFIREHEIPASFTTLLPDIACSLRLSDVSMDAYHS